MTDHDGNEVPLEDVRRIDRAKDYLTKLRQFTQDQIQSEMVRIAGRYLPAFLLSYAQQVMNKSPDNYMNNGSALFILGYLIRAEEERAKKPADVTFFSQDKVGQA